MSDYSEGNFEIWVTDTGIPSGGRYSAKIVETQTREPVRKITRYVYGLTKDEALLEAKKLISEC